ncbi:Sugar transferase involved in LPS biosynthesis (colanic, teichoic acid) [Tranquillimonas rosea]|uniref:Sugar transferase involved in LPS biosynthesis (Colanic, teichoic acid) n=1 Tax=Tranquillimonas rosea TaxID=641238 RepID=A0A1H9X336_9RHOB|nr:sugar transferase [Tranquillimonas rosea]SES40441.1 Sugar transferase involved in LPS biosynthesis (colanic, teichoic acid) [Tranquillimonas rosea]
MTITSLQLSSEESDFYGIPVPLDGTVPSGIGAAGMARRAVATGALVLADAGAFAVVGLLLAPGLLASSAVIVPVLAFAGAVQIGMKAASGLYPGIGHHPEAVLRRAVAAWAGALVIAAGGAVMLTGATPAQVALLAVLFAAVGLLQIAAGWLVRFVLRRTGLGGMQVRLFGTPERVEALSEFLNAQPGYGLTPTRDPGRAEAALWAGNALPEPATLELLRRQFAEVLLVSDLPKARLSGVTPVQHGGTLGLRLSGHTRRGTVSAAKRAVDLAVTVPAMMVAAPVLLVFAAAIKIVDPGPAFYVQMREGLGGRRIGVLKLRTMYRDADRMLEDLLARDPDARKEWETHYKLRNDPRILPVVGRVLRASSLDELPQLFNILRGDMTLVGPRPFPEYHLAAMRPEFRARRASVVPGLTGLWQISDRSAADVAQQEQLDGYYIDNRSFWFDLSIILRTFAAVIGRKGAY